MQNSSSFRATIQPVPEDAPRPLWSVMIPTYNCARYLRETLTSVLSQAPGPEVMQIEVIDDHSTQDDPEAVVRELGGDRVTFYRQPENVGYIRNFETCLQRSRGQLVHLLHGDDVVLQGFYQKLYQVFEQNPGIGAAFCRYILMDEQGHWQSISPLDPSKNGLLQNSLEQIVVHCPIQVASMVVKRNVYESLGGFDQRFVCSCEDWEMWARIAVHYPVGYAVEPLAAYRYMGIGSLTKNSVRSGKYAQDMRKAHTIISSYLYTHLSQPAAGKLVNQSRDSFALIILNLASQMLEIGDTKAALIQIQEALNCSRSLKVTQQIVWMFLKTGKYQIKDAFNALASFRTQNTKPIEL
jgi:glycosyltransferase involved in cell wall biosynthesis